MAKKVLVSESSLAAIGDAIREKNETTVKYKPAEMAEAIKSIKTGDIYNTTGDVSIISSDMWAVNLIQTANQTVSSTQTVSLTTVSGKYAAQLKIATSITAFVGYLPGQIVKTVDENTHTITITAKDAEAIDGMVEDGWTLVYVGTDGIYSDAEYKTKIASSALGGDLCVAGRKTSIQSTQPNGSSNSTATKWKDNFITQITSSSPGGSFYGWSALTSLDLPNLEYVYGDWSPLGLCCGCKKLINVNLPSLTNLNGYAFNSCSSLTSIDLPVCTSIGSSAFNSCSSLTSIDLPACTSIGSYAFNSCSSLTFIDLPACTSIGEYAFNSCSSLTSIDLPVCTSIGSSAFYSCSSLTSIDLPACTSIGSSAFYSCSSLTSIDLPACTSIGEYAFNSCSSLTSIDLPACTSIGSYAFNFCSSLTSIDLPACTSIGSYAFDYFGSINLTTVILRSPTMCKLEGSVSFRNSALKIYVPEALLDEYKAASYWSSWANKFASLEEYEASAANAISLDDDGISTLELEDTQIGVDELIAAAENDLKTAQTLGDPTDYIEERLKELYAERDGTSVDDGTASVDDDTVARPVAD